jgi:tRNA (Thr-GGU) A37 N-methylase
VGLHRLEITAIHGQRMQVRNLEVLDGTPIIDVKPILSGDISQRLARSDPSPQLGYHSGKT